MSFQVLKNFSVENLETTPSTFTSKFSSKIYSSRIIYYWGSIFTLYLTEERSAWFVFYPYSSCQYFTCQTITNYRMSGKGEGVIIFLVLYFHPLANIHLVYRDFYHFFLINLFVIITRLIADVTCSSKRFTFYLHFHDAIESELLTLTFQSDIVRIWAHIKLSPFYYKANALTNWDWHPSPQLFIYHTYATLPLATTYPLSVCQNV